MKYISYHAIVTDLLKNAYFKFCAIKVWAIVLISKVKDLKYVTKLDL